ncbi:MAG: leucine-rich repeat domain-containing protein [Bacteroidaceae bacterium]|nr:leucine-rich repeat domain-containing protein [Bacteroidaceae bacterium]
MTTAKHFLLTALLTAVGSLRASAYDFSADGLCYNILSDDDATCELTYRSDSFASYAGDIVVPATVSHQGRHYTVSAIGNSAFDRCPNLTSVTLPPTVTEIGEWAFFQCFRLKRMDIPSSVTVIGECAFRRCSQLASVRIPDSVTELRGGAFELCSALQAVELPPSVTTMGESVFRKCTALTSVVIPDSVTELGVCAFEGCAALKSAVLPSRLCMLSEGAFRDCSNLTAIHARTATPPICDEGVFEGVPRERCAVFVPAEAVADYQADEAWGGFAVSAAQ